MKDHNQIIQDLRHLCKDGATPSRLIQHIVRWVGITVSYRDIIEILEKAFTLPIVRIGPSVGSSDTKVKGDVLNKTLLMEIVERRAEWDEASSSTTPFLPSWMDGLRAASPQNTEDNLRSSPIAGLSNEKRAILSLDEQNAIYVQLSSAVLFSQRVEVLSKLAERLQEKINELEEKLIPSGRQAS
jgi:hypothetical protein